LAIHASLEFHLANATFTSSVKERIFDRLANFELQSDAQKVIKLSFSAESTVYC
jgi:hypothetical protein